MTTISIRLEDDMKKELESLCDDMGMNLSTLFVIYAKKVLRERRIPFEVAAPPVFDPDKLDWDRIGKQLAEAERINKDAPGVPWEEVYADMRRRVHGRTEAV